MTTLILVILLFVLLIFPHELGHFLVAKACGVQVNEFAFGMGPAIFKKQGKETLYSTRLVPIGGYTALEGEDTEEADDNPRAFNNKKWWQKILVLVAGAGMNMLIACIVLTAVIASSGFVETSLESVVAGGPAETAGILAGDTITAIGDTETPTWTDVTTALEKYLDDGETLTVTVERDGETLTFDVTPALNENGKYIIGIQASVSHDVIRSVGYGVRSTGRVFVLILQSFAQIFREGNVLENVSGPVGMVQMVNETSDYGLSYFLYLVALVSVNLAIFNLLPFPALDGGRIIFVIIRQITGKAISDTVEARVHAVGMGLLLVLAAVIAVNDVLRLLS